ncbi:DUF188 domain-containing protein [Salibacterium lacus]|uniref:UPF0178 protein ACFSUB_01640 n=1 Tax=Salibacterium lacus TaxID=1898109 RepID=A0ABW5SWL8_9BACI
MLIAIYTDADACPVKQEIDSFAFEHGIPSYFVFSLAHVSNRSYHSIPVVLDNEPEAVDVYIHNHAGRGDIIITGDNGLAAMMLQKGTVPVSPRGTVFREKDMDALLIGRYEGIKAKQKKTRIKGPPPMTKTDRLRFVQALKELHGEQK